MRWRLSCREHRENISLLASGALPETQQRSARDHLAQCAHCRQAYEEIATVSGAFQQWARTEPPAEPRAAFSSRWRRSIENVNSPPRASTATLLSRWSAWLWPSPVAWGGLATVWICLLFLNRAAPAQPTASQQLARSTTHSAPVTFAQRQNELASLLESLAPPPAPSNSDKPRPRSQLRVQSSGA